MFPIFLLEKENQNHGMFARNVDAGQMLHASEENYYEIVHSRTD
jgi:hypothetical protein